MVVKRSTNVRGEIYLNKEKRRKTRKQWASFIELRAEQETSKKPVFTKCKI